MKWSVKVEIQILSAEMENLRKLESNHRFSNEYNVYT